MRLIHAVREINETRAEPIAVIALYTEPERQAMFVRHADEAYCLGPATAVGADGRRRNGYLDHAALERALVATRADAVWPGWGFVAEDPAFADLCERLGIVFVGPSADAMRRLGDKIEAKRLADRHRRAGRAVERRAGRTSSRTPQRHARRDRLPADGQGGRRRRRARHPPRRRARRARRARSRAPAPRRTTRSATTRCFMERLVTPARHIEVQVIADGEGAAWAVGVRDCSCQRRNQKVIEESASPALTAAQEDAGRASPPRGWRSPAATAAPARSSSSTSPTSSASRSWRSTPACRSSIPVTEAVDGARPGQAAAARRRGRPARGRAARAAPATPIEARLNAEDPALGLRAHARAASSGSSCPPAPGCGSTAGSPRATRSRRVRLDDRQGDRLRAATATRRWRGCGARCASTVVGARGRHDQPGFLLELLDRPELRAARSTRRGWTALRLGGEPARVRGARRRRWSRRRSSSPTRRPPPTARSFYALARRGRPQARPQTGRTVDLRHRGQAYRLRVWHIGPGRRRVEPSTAPSSRSRSSSCSDATSAG